MKLAQQHLRHQPQRMALFRGGQVRIWSGEHQQWWLPGGYGYTSDQEQAGVFEVADAWARVEDCGPEKKISLVAA